LLLFLELTGVIVGRLDVDLAACLGCCFERVLCSDN